METSLYLSKIMEYTFDINSSLDSFRIDKESLLFKYNLTIEPDFEKKKLSFKTEINYSISHNGEKIMLLKFGLILKYHISEIESIIKIENEGEHLITNKDLIVRLININIGTLRGALYYKTKGTLLEDYPLPITDSDFVRKLAENLK